MFNPDRPFVFGSEFFNKHQKLLLLFANTFIGRYILRIHGKRSEVGRNKITKIIPNALFWTEGEYKKVEFRTHNKYSKRLFYSFRLIWYIFHFWDILFANNFYPRLNLGFDSLTVYPNANTESTSVDGNAYYDAGASNAGFATIRAAAGNRSQDSDSEGYAWYIQTYTADWSLLIRSFFLFDTSPLTSNANISSAIMSLYSTLKTSNNSLSSTNAGGSLVTSTPASNTAIVNADYSQLGTTKQATDIPYDSITTASYNDWTLNATGLSNISKTSITKFGMRMTCDCDNTNPIAAGFSSLETEVTVYFADRVGTTQDPKLVITYAGISPSSSISPSISPSASLSPSSSISPSASRSPSSSVSPSISPSSSRSPSSSISPSSSVSPSISPSASLSPSSSVSPSISPSSSISPSASVSSSISPSSSSSPSPSAGYSLYTRDQKTVLPINNADLPTFYTDLEEVTVSTRDNMRVGQKGIIKYMIHQFKVFVGPQTFCNIEWEGQTTLAPSISTVYLQVFNQTTSLWETVDKEDDEEEDIDFELEGKIANSVNYKDSSQVLSCRVYQLAI